MPDHEHDSRFKRPEELPLGYEPIAEFESARLALAYLGESAGFHRDPVPVQSETGFSVWIRIHQFWID